MADERRKFKREGAEARREALIQAALEMIAHHGVRGATVRAIAERADVTQGLIRHYFKSKEDLISAAYEYHMTQMTDLTEAPALQVSGTASHRLEEFVRASLSGPVVAPQNIALWAGFLNKVQNDPAMKAIHARTYSDFRDRLEGLIRACCLEAGNPVEPGRLRQLAIACNALIDGLWLEAGALPDAFEPGELISIGLRSVSAILNVELSTT